MACSGVTSAVVLCGNWCCGVACLVWCVQCGDWCCGVACVVWRLVLWCGQKRSNIYALNI